VITTLEFFTKLYGDAPQGHFYIWIKWPGKDKRSKTLWCDTLRKAAEEVAFYNGETNVYFGICTSERIKDYNQRTKFGDVHMMPAFVLDVDYTLPSHAKPGLPATREEALAIIEAAPLQATIIVESGGGFHAYWKFSEPLIFHNDDERTAAHDLSHAWQNRFRADNPGITFDSTHDLPRIFRAPGSQNKNSGGMCRVLTMDGPEYTMADIRPLITLEPQQPKPKSKPLTAAARTTPAIADPVPSSGQSSPTPAAAPAMSPTPGPVGSVPFPLMPGVFMEGQATPRAPGKFDVETQVIVEILTEKYTKFSKAMKPGPLDMSGADALALRLYVNECVNMVPPQNPSRQVCYDLMSLLRHQDGRKPGSKDKAFRLDYLESTVADIIKNSKPKKGADKAADKAAKEKELVEAATVAATGPLERKIETVSDYLGLRISNLVKYVGTDPQLYSFDVQMPGGLVRTVHVTIQDLLNYKLFETKWSAVTCKAILAVTNQGDWKMKVFSQFITLFQEQDIPEEATAEGQLRRGILSYLYSLVPMDDASEALAPRNPFWMVHQGSRKLFIFFDRFVEFMMAHSCGESLSGRKIALMISQFKITAPVQIRIPSPDGTLSKERVYPIPEDMIAAYHGASRTNMLAAQAGDMDIPEEEMWNPDPPPTQ